MAKEIKAIQCPKCGSTRKVTIKPDFYRCASCDTEYFLDNDDIVITHNVNHNIPANKQAPGPVSPKKGARIVLFLSLMVPVMLFLFNRITGGANRTTTTGREDKAELQFTWWDSDKVAYTGTGGQPVLVCIGQRDYMGSDRETQNGKYIAFYDLPSGKELKVQRLEGMSKESSGSFTFRTFENGDIYAIFNKTLVFKINKAVMMAEEVTKTMFSKVPELNSGIANAEFVYKNYGDGFNIMTNEGRSYFYYPAINKVFTKEELYDACKTLEQKDPAAPVKTYYAFVAPEGLGSEKKQLITYTQKDNAGGPKDDPYFMSIVNNNDKPKLTFRWGAGLVLSFSIIGPERGYFDPELLYSDGQYVLFKSNTTAAKEAPTSLQCLDVHTGNILFTLPFTETRYFDETIRYKDGFVVKSNNSMLLVGSKGNLIKEYKTI